MSRSIPSVLTALGREPLPSHIEWSREQHRLERVFKNDFFAVTALYVGESRKVVLKIGRRASFFGIPLRWIGRFLAAKERSALLSLQDIEGIPRCLGGWRDTGLVREYVEGHALARREHVPDDFHARLRALIHAIHQRGMAFVDLEKPSNVIVGDDGRPYLVDFQICWRLPRKWGGELLPARWIRRFFQRGDLYHLTKLQRRTRPDQMTPEALADSYRKPWYVRAYTVLTRPFTLSRRAVLNLVAPRGGPGERGLVDENGASQQTRSRLNAPFPCQGEGWGEGPDRTIHPAPDLSAQGERGFRVHS